MDSELTEACTELFRALPWLIKWLLYLGLAALVVHLILEVVDRIAKLFPSANQTRYRTGPDPIKLIDALKGFLEALKNAPLWIAIFVLAMAFWFVAQTGTPSMCPANPQQVASQKQTGASQAQNSAGQPQNGAGQTQNSAGQVQNSVGQAQNGSAANRAPAP